MQSFLIMTVLRRDCYKPESFFVGFSGEERKAASLSVTLGLPRERSNQSVGQETIGTDTPAVCFPRSNALFVSIIFPE